MKSFIGTSGFSYKAWKGHFYPDSIKPAEMLRYFATRLSAVEINNTFYRLPKQSVLEGWASSVPDTFRFSIKVSRRVTHFKRLSEESLRETEFLLETTQTLGDKLGVLFYQLPPMFAANPERLDNYLSLMPKDGPRRAFEFRNRSWFTDEVFAVLRKHNVAMCIADADSSRVQVPVVSTADWGYLRLRKARYDAEDLQEWNKRMRDFGWEQAYIFFKHEEAGAGPVLAETFGAVLSNEVS